MRFSIIMPVYNAAGTLRKSLDSIAAQTFRDFEIVFIDDCSTDETSSILKVFHAESGIPCRIIRQPVNGGVASARNRGLESATGDFLAFVDADDRLEPHALEKAVAALKPDTDILGWDWTLGFEKNGRYMRQADYATPAVALENLLCGVMRWNLWLFLIRREFVLEHELRFIDGANMGEDMQFMIKAFLKAGEVVQIHEALYRYNAVSDSSISRQFSQRRRAEIETNLREAERVVMNSPSAASLQNGLQHLKLFLKLPLLISNDKENYELWYNWFPEANTFAMKNRRLPLRTRLLQGMAAKRFWTGIRIYYVFIHKFVYGILYR